MIENLKTTVRTLSSLICLGLHCAVKISNCKKFKPDFLIFLELELLHRCLDPFVSRRPAPGELQSELLGGRTEPPPAPFPFQPPAFPTLDMRCCEMQLPVSCKRKRPLDYLAVREIYYLWQLAGGDVWAELRKHGLMITTPPVVSIPSLVVGEGQVKEGPKLSN